MYKSSSGRNLRDIARLTEGSSSTTMARRGGPVGSVGAGPQGSFTVRSSGALARINCINCMIPGPRRIIKTPVTPTDPPEVSSMLQPSAYVKYDVFNSDVGPPKT
jgi:hypothetical protein